MAGGGLGWPIHENIAQFKRFETSWATQIICVMSTMINGWHLFTSMQFNTKRKL